MRIDKLLNEANLFKRHNKGLSPELLFLEFDSFKKLDEVDDWDKPKAMRKLMLTFEVDDIDLIKLADQADYDLGGLPEKQWEKIQKAITMSKKAKNKKP
ncbi:MAG: hypothetical protein IKP56_04610 [Bacilli bacterium]|nr:hypothetical protein [Bacilli bacterium]